MTEQKNSTDSIRAPQNTEQQAQELAGNQLVTEARKILAANRQDTSHEARLAIAAMRNADMDSGRKP